MHRGCGTGIFATPNRVIDRGLQGAQPERSQVFRVNEVLDLLRGGMRPAGEIARSFTVSRPAISKHLAVLRRAHLVEERREGRHRVYQLNPEPLKAVDSWLDQYRNFWVANLSSLKAFVEAEYEKETRGTAARRNPNKEK